MTRDELYIEMLELAEETGAAARKELFHLFDDVPASELYEMYHQFLWISDMIVMYQAQNQQYAPAGHVVPYEENDDTESVGC